MAAVVEAVGLSKHFRTPGGAAIRAVDRASFALQAGQVLGLLGGPGAGKTTLLRLLGGELQPTRGRLEVHVRPLLLDEPDTGAAQIPPGTTAVVATGDLATALSLCHVIAPMDRGQVLPPRSAAEVRALCPADRYQIRLQGHLPDRWASHFEPMRITNLPDGGSLLEGTVVDQAALHGVLGRLRDLGLPLVSVAPLLPTLPELLSAWL